MKVTNDERQLMVVRSGGQSLVVVITNPGERAIRLASPSLELEEQRGQRSGGEDDEHGGPTTPSGAEWDWVGLLPVWSSELADRPETEAAGLSVKTF
ncbi:unnamed protein product [Calypogeia fissa]